MIPRVLHYCWLGGASLPNSVRLAKDSWIRAMPDYEIVEWNEANTSLDSCEYVRWCAENRRWAHLSDYVKADVLRRYGGIFLDADVMVHRRFDSFLHHPAFSGFERAGLPFTAVWGSEAGHPWPKAAELYLQSHSHASLAEAGERLEPNTNWMSRMLTSHFDIEPMIDTYQEGRHGVAIYPSETFCLGAHVGWATHMFSGSWVTSDQKGAWGQLVGNTREASIRLELASPALLMRLARVTDFVDGGETANRLGAARGRYTTSELPADVGPFQAGRAFAEAIAQVTKLYWKGLSNHYRTTGKGNHIESPRDSI